MSDAITMNNNNNNTSKNFENAFPDPTEDVFWQKVSTIINEDDDENSTNNVDVIWNPNKKDLNQKKNQEIINNFIIAPPPQHSITNIYTRHSRKNSRVSWELQTDSERHIELLETKLNDVISNHKRTHTRSSTVDFDSLGYYPEEVIGSGTVFEDEEEEIGLHHDNHNPQESDEGLWLLWRNQSTSDFSDLQNDNDTSTNTNQSWYLPILSRSNNNDNENNNTNNNIPRLPRMRSENYVGNYRELPLYYEDEEDGYDLNDEILLSRANRKKEKEYLKFNTRSYECCGCNTTNGLCAGLWRGWCCNWLCLPTILFIREKCCCGACSLKDD